ncbi:universal stress protein [Haloarchaeobius amylolyticus]|uniref:universal stress protein n=1 Tax=Haloarchaeobius amylolyticus TaxID=1198296 RepID=UPI0022719677|nr:universal stress protein [Haloarchaeobius amylolyticus]
MYDRILVATDGSADANRAATHALEQAERHGAELHALFVVDTDRYAEPALSSTELDTTEIEDWGGEQLDEIVDRGEQLGLTVTTRCCHGKPYVEIINYADEVDADLIVLGYHGHSHTETEQIGSVTDRVVQNAGRPVLIAT